MDRSVAAPAAVEIAGARTKILFISEAPFLTSIYIFSWLFWKACCAFAHTISDTFAGRVPPSDRVNMGIGQQQSKQEKKE